MRKLMLLGAMAGGKLVEDTATGNPVTFETDVAKPLKSLLIPFTPRQEGSGDPSPQNIRSIRPWNGLKVFGGGKNLLNPNTDEWEKRLETYLYINGVVPAGATARFTLEVKDDTADISGCYLGFIAENLAESSPVNYRWVIENGTVKSDMSNLSSGSAQFQRRCSNVFIYPATNETVQKLFNRFNIMVELGTTATDYEPYHPITDTDIVFPSAVYGGEHEAVSGRLMDGWKVVDMGSLEWTYRSGDDNFTAPTPSDAFDMISSADIINNFSCEVYKGVFSFVGNNVITMNNRSTGLTKLIRVRDQSFGEDAEAFTAFVTGKKLAYKLATPTEQTLTGHQITDLVGNNTIWSDADGDIEVTYLKKA